MATMVVTLDINYFRHITTSILFVYRLALRRRHCVGGGAPVNFGRVQSQKIGGGKKFCSKVSERISFYFQNFLLTFLVIDRKLQVHSKNGAWFYYRLRYYGVSGK